MTELVPGGVGDPLTFPFWDAARHQELAVQRCEACGHHQFYPRPFCLECSERELKWVSVSGNGRIYSLTTIYFPVSPDFDPPYTVAVVELDEGPRILTHLVDGVDAEIGDPVRVAWQDRGEAPPLPVFERQVEP